MTEAEETRPPLPPFARETAIEKVRKAEDAWNTRDPARVAPAYTRTSTWRNRSEFFAGRDEIIAFLTRKWSKELDYRLIKELWAFTDDRISVRFQYEYHDDAGNWFRAYGNEQWAFAPSGLMHRREASINDVPINAADRKFLWPEPGPRPAEYPGLTELGL
jgi:nuclear transport factor 2 (NTF2) superfamily protein